MRFSRSRRRRRFSRRFAGRLGAGLEWRTNRRRAQNLDLLLRQASLLPFDELGRFRLLFDGFARGLGKALLEALHATGGIHKLLTARKKRMAVRADFQPDAGLGRARLERITTGANNRA